MTWKSLHLGEACNIVKGSASALNEPPGEYSMVVTAAERKTAASYQFDGEAVCIPLVSSTGHGNAAINRIHYQSGKFAVASILAAVVPKSSDLSCKFLYYFFCALKDLKLVPLMKGTSNVSLTIKKLRNVEISFPSLDEQMQIVRRLDHLHGKMDERQAVLQLLERDAEAMLQSAFRHIVDGAKYQALSEVAPLVRRQVAVVLNGEYSELGVRSFGKGTFHKPTLTGAEVGNKRLFEIHEKDFAIQHRFRLGGRDCRAWQRGSWTGGIAPLLDVRSQSPEDDGKFSSLLFSNSRRSSQDWGGLPRRGGPK